MKKYIDIPLALFIVIMIAAASITSHGTFVFYSYFLDYELAMAATVVLTVGIPFLEWAAVLHEKYRWRYVGGMLWLLLMEAVAQYWQGQAVFASRVARQFPDATGIDIAILAAHPWGRLLPIAYLASLSAVVVYFGYAASRRVADLRGMQHAVNTDVATEQQPATLALTMPEVVKLIDIDGLTAAQVALRFSVTRQAISQRYAREKTRWEQAQLTEATT